MGLSFKDQKTPLANVSVHGEERGLA